MNNIGHKIRYLRDKAGYTQTYLAKRLGISRSAVNAWEMSLSVPSLANVVEMASIFHVSTDYFLSQSNKLLVDITHLKQEEQEVILKIIDCFDKTDKEDKLS